MSLAQPASSSSTIAPSATTTPALPDLESIVAAITAAPPPAQLAPALSAAARRDVGDAILASVLPSGQDPLAVLDPHAHTLGFLYILSARLGMLGEAPVPFATVAQFCRVFQPEQARLAPERVTMLARNIVTVAESQHNLKAAVGPLYDLTTRYPPSLAHLTTVHTSFLHACVASQHYTHALPVLSVPIAEIDTTLSALSYHDVLQYHYTGGLALLALKRFRAAAAHLETCVAAPAHGPPAALQLEALKKLTLVRLILYGSTPPLPKYAHPSLARYLKATPYAAFARAYTGPAAALRDLVEKEAKLFDTERNLGLVRQALAHAPRWAVRTLTATYLTLRLPELARALGEADEGAVRALVLSMVERGEIAATLDAAGTVTFRAAAGAPSGPGDVDGLVRAAQAQGAVLGALDREVGRSREFLTKAVREKDGGVLDEMELYGAGPPPGYGRDWDEGGF